MGLKQVSNLVGLPAQNGQGGAVNSIRLIDILFSAEVEKITLIYNEDVHQKNASICRMR